MFGRRKTSVKKQKKRNKQEDEADDSSVVVRPPSSAAGKDGRNDSSEDDQQLLSAVLKPPFSASGTTTKVRLSSTSSTSTIGSGTFSSDAPSTSASVFTTVSRQSGLPTVSGRRNNSLSPARTRQHRARSALSTAATAARTMTSSASSTTLSSSLHFPRATSPTSAARGRTAANAQDPGIADEAAHPAYATTIPSLVEEPVAWVPPADLIDVIESIYLLKPAELRRFLIDRRQDANRQALIEAAINFNDMTVRDRSAKCVQYLIDHGMSIPFIQQLMADAVEGRPFRAKLLLLPRTALMTKYIFNEHYSSLFSLREGEAANALVLLEWATLNGIDFPFEALPDSTIHQYVSTATQMLLESPLHCPLLYIAILLVERFPRDFINTAARLLESAVLALDSEGLLEDVVRSFNTEGVSLYGAHALEDATYQYARRLFEVYGYGLERAVTLVLTCPQLVSYFHALQHHLYVDSQYSQISPCLPFPPEHPPRHEAVINVLNSMEETMLAEWLAVYGKLSEYHNQLYLSFQLFKTKVETLLLEHENFHAANDIAATHRFLDGGTNAEDVFVKDALADVKRILSEYQKAADAFRHESGTYHFLLKSYEATYAPVTASTSTTLNNMRPNKSARWQWVTYPQRPQATDASTTAVHEALSTDEQRSTKGLTLKNERRHGEMSPPSAPELLPHGNHPDEAAIAHDMRVCQDLSAIATTLRRQLELYRLSQFREYFRSIKRDVVYMQPLQELLGCLMDMRKRHEKKEVKKAAPQTLFGGFGGGFDLSMLTSKLEQEAKKQQHPSDKGGGTVSKSQALASTKGEGGGSRSKLFSADQPKSGTSNSESMSGTSDSSNDFQMTVPELVEKVRTLRSDLALLEGQPLPKMNSKASSADNGGALTEEEREEEERIREDLQALYKEAQLKVQDVLATFKN